MRILLLTQWFQPEPMFKGLPFAKALVEMGYDVEVLTGFPNYPGGKVYPGYHLRLWQREIMDGIRINRIALFPSHDRIGWRRILNYLSFAFCLLLVGIWLVRRPKIIYVFNLVTLMPFAVMLSFLTKAKILLDVQDLWPESVSRSNMLENRLSLRLLNMFCLWAYRHADWLTVLSPGFKQNLVNRGLSVDRIEVIYNWCDEAALSYKSSFDNSNSALDFKGKFLVIFAGTMGMMQGLDAVLNAAEICQVRSPQAQFVLIGSGVDRIRLETVAKEKRLSNVTFIPPRPQSGMRPLLENAGALLVHLKDDPLFRITIPSKTQAYMFVGKPIIMAMAGDAAELVAQAGAGICCRPDDGNALASAVEQLMKMTESERRAIGSAGAEFYQKHLSMAVGIRLFANRFEVLSRS